MKKIRAYCQMWMTVKKVRHGQWNAAFTSGVAIRDGNVTYEVHGPNEQIKKNLKDFRKDKGTPKSGYLTKAQLNHFIKVNSGFRFKKK